MTTDEYIRLAWTIPEVGLSDVDKIERDRVIYGTGYAMTMPDGTVRHIPADRVISVHGHSTVAQLESAARHIEQNCRTMMAYDAGFAAYMADQVVAVDHHWTGQVTVTQCDPSIDQAAERLGLKRRLYESDAELMARNEYVGGRK